MRRVADKIHIAAKNDIAFANQIDGDMEKYIQGTEEARNQLKQEIQGWKGQAREVNQGYKEAF